MLWKFELTSVIVYVVYERDSERSDTLLWQTSGKIDFYFPPYDIIWKQNYPLKWVISDVFLLDVCQLRSRHIGSLFVCSRFWWWNFFHQILSNLPYNATEIVRFLKTFKTSVFFETIDGFFGKKNSNFCKITKGDKFAVECISNGIISWKCLFRPNYQVFLAKKKLNVGKIRKYDEERVFLREKNFFIFLKAFFTKMAQNMPVVASRLVIDIN